jgi:hypothetical protein
MDAQTTDESSNRDQSFSVVAYVTEDYHLWMPFDLLLPAFNPVIPNLVGFQYGEEGPKASPSLFNIHVSAGRGAVISKDFVFAMAEVNPHMISEAITILPTAEASYQGYHDGIIDLQGNPRWNIIGSTKVVFWLLVAGTETFVEVRYHAAITDSHLSGNHDGTQMWIGSDTGRIVPNLNPQLAGDFVVTEDNHFTPLMIDSLQQSAQ